MVYYAGHGMEIGGVNYLLPTDAKLLVDHDAENQAVALEQVGAIKRAGANVSLTYLAPELAETLGS